MTNISGFALASKKSISVSGAAFRITAPNKKQSYKLYRQFQNANKELLLAFNGEYPPFNLQKFKIHTKNRDVYSIIDDVYTQLNKTDSKDKDIFELIKNTSIDNTAVLKIWNKSFASKEFISDDYQGYIFADDKMHIWIYDLIPANTMLSKVNEDNPLPTPGKHITYSIETGDSNIEILKTN